MSYTHTAFSIEKFVNILTLAIASTLCAVMVFARKTRCARRDKKRDPPKDFGQNPGGTVYIAFSSINSGHAESAPGGV